MSIDRKPASSEEESNVAFSVPERNASEQHRVLRQLFRRRTAVLGLIIIVFELLLIGFGPFFVPFDPIEPSMSERFLPPSPQHLMGTDDLGRDLFTRVLYGGRISLMVGFFAVSLGMLLGVPLGLIAGYAGGYTEEGVMRFIDVLLSFPGMLLAIVIVATLGPSTVNVVIAVAIFSTPAFARVVRGVTLSLKQSTYVEAARAIGAGHTRIMSRHILTNVMAPIVVLFSLNIGMAIISATGLNFIGLGGKPPTPEWGLMLSSGRDFLRHEWWVATFPGIAILVTVLAMNLLGDGLRDALDPRMQKT